MDTNIKSPAVYNSAPQNQAAQNGTLKTEENKQKKENKKDVYNDTPLRKLGFLDEYGEALRPVLSASKNPVVRQLPNFAYIPATAYMLADVVDKYQKGEDGTGEKPSIKMGARQAMYQGLVSVAAPVAIVKGVHKLTDKFSGKIASKIPDTIKKSASSAFESIKKNKTAGKFLSKAGMPAKIAGALISIVAVSKLSKPVDFLADKLFNHVVDPLMGINKNEEK
ncbi:TPA: hypothetical protein IAA82_02890 [Candidatus Galligastranaerophilus gallistercoris]|nr:hypothetical protein [Candidatus Galligastranaerophilus gallistercoris]